MFMMKNNMWQSFSSLHMCNELSNVFLIPVERLKQPGYEIFINQSTGEKQPEVSNDSGLLKECENI